MDNIRDPLPHRWRTFVLGWLVYAAFGMGMATLAPLVHLISADLRISASGMGIILGAWLPVSAVTAPLAGAIIDRVGLRLSLTLAALAIAVTPAVESIASDFSTMLAAVAFFGAGGIFISIGLPKLVAVWFEGKERQLAAGLCMTAPATGSILVLATSNGLVLPLLGSWRQVIGLWAVLILVLATLWLLFSKNPPPAGGGRQSTSPSPVRALLELARIPLVATVLVMNLAFMVTIHSLNNWLPEILRHKGLSPQEAGFWAALPIFVAVPSALLLPRLTPKNRRGVVVTLFLVSEGVAALIIGVSSWPLAGVGLALWGVEAYTTVAMMMLLLMDSPAVGPARMGAAAGLYYCLGQLAGVTGPVLVGALFDLTGTFVAGLAFIACLNFLAAAFAFVAMPQALRLAPKAITAQGNGSGTQLR